MQGSVMDAQSPSMLFSSPSHAMVMAQPRSPAHGPAATMEEMSRRRGHHHRGDDGQDTDEMMMHQQPAQSQDHSGSGMGGGSPSMAAFSLDASGAGGDSSMLLMDDDAFETAGALRHGGDHHHLGDLGGDLGDLTDSPFMMGAGGGSVGRFLDGLGGAVGPGRDDFAAPPVAGPSDPGHGASAGDGVSMGAMGSIMSGGPSMMGLDMDPDSPKLPPPQRASTKSQGRSGRGSTGGGGGANASSRNSNSSGGGGGGSTGGNGGNASSSNTINTNGGDGGGASGNSGGSSSAAKRASRGGYKCAKCGKPKKGHICTYSGPDMAVVSVQCDMGSISAEQEIEELQQLQKRLDNARQTIQHLQAQMAACGIPACSPGGASSY